MPARTKGARAKSLAAQDRTPGAEWPIVLQDRTALRAKIVTLIGSTPPAPHAPTHQNGGSDEINVAGLSGLLADPQTPLAHAASHAVAGGDTVNVTTLAGFPGGTTTFLNAAGAFSVPTGTGANTALSNLASVAVNVSLLPGVTNTIDLGSATFTWRTGYFRTGVQTNLITAIVAGGITIDAGGGGATVSVTGDLLPTTSATYALGSSTKRWLTGVFDTTVTANTVQLRDTLAASPDVQLRNTSYAATITGFTLYPASGTNIANIVGMSPRGTGTATIKAEILCFNTDYLADNINYEFVVMRAAGGSYGMAGGKSGSGSLRPFIMGVDIDNLNNQLYFDTNFCTGIRRTAPTSYLHLAAGTTAANTAPLGFTSGSLLTTAVAGKMEFLTDALYFTITTGAVRKTIAFLESPVLVTPNIGAATGTSVSLSGTLNLLSTGAAATAGQSTLVAGTVTVNTTAMTATARLFLQRKTAGGTVGDLTYTQVNNTSFTINSANALDTSVVNWTILETH